MRFALDRLLGDDTFFTEPIRVVLEDDGIRDAIGVPPDLTFEVYIQRVRKASVIRDRSRRLPRYPTWATRRCY